MYITKRQGIVKHSNSGILDCVGSYFEEHVSFEVISFVNTINSSCGWAPDHNTRLPSTAYTVTPSAQLFSWEKIMISLSGQGAADSFTSETPSSLHKFHFGSFIIMTRGGGSSLPASVSLGLPTPFALSNSSLHTCIPNSFSQRLRNFSWQSSPSSSLSSKMRKELRLEYYTHCCWP